jgi:hypothetical protein
LSAGAYLLSKVTVLGLITGLQAALLVLIGVSGVPLPRHGAYLPSPLAEILLAVVVLAIASMTVGLAVSAFVDSSEKTMQALVLIAIAQVMLSGGVLALGVGLQQLSYVAPARWGFGATASTADLNTLLRGSGKPVDHLWDHRPRLALAGHTDPARAGLHAHRLVAPAPHRPRPGPAADRVPDPATQPASAAGLTGRPGRGRQPPAACANAPLTAERMAGMVVVLSMGSWRRGVPVRSSWERIQADPPHNKPAPASSGPAEMTIRNVLPGRSVRQLRQRPFSGLAGGDRPATGGLLAASCVLTARGSATPTSRPGSTQDRHHRP